MMKHKMKGLIDSNFGCQPAFILNFVYFFTEEWEGVKSLADNVPCLSSGEAVVLEFPFLWEADYF